MHFPDFGQFRSSNFERKTFSTTTELRRKYMILPGEIYVVCIAQNKSDSEIADKYYSSPNLREPAVVKLGKTERKTLPRLAVMNK